MDKTSADKTTIIEFPNGNIARYTTVSQNVDIDVAIKKLGLVLSRALLVINGGTGNLNSLVEQRLKEVFDHLARFVIDERVTVVTGGTNAKLFELFGCALQRHGGPSAPCIGVTLEECAELNKLESHHSHFISVKGKTWGNETSVMYRLIHELSKNRPSLALVAGGGEITIKEMVQNVLQNREMIFVGGVGGVTDAIIAAKKNTSHLYPKITDIVKNAQIEVFNAYQTPHELVSILRNKLLDNGTK